MTVFQSISDEELTGAMVQARKVGGEEAYYSIIGLLERGRLDEAEAFAADLGSAGIVEGFQVLAEHQYGPGSNRPDPARCLELAKKHTDPQRPYYFEAVALAGWGYEQSGNVQLALKNYRLATSDPNQVDEPAICHAWARRAALLLRPGPMQDILEAAGCLIAAVESDYRWPVELEAGLPINQDGSWRSAAAFTAFFNSSPKKRRGELALLLMSAGMLEPYGVTKAEHGWWRHLAG